MGITNKTMQLSMHEGEEKSMEKQIVRWVICETGKLHIFANCPSCYSIQGGLLVTTVQGNFMGTITAECTDCSESIDYYIDVRENGIWRMEAVDTKKRDIFT